VDEIEMADRRMDAVDLLAEITPRHREAFLLHQYGFTQEEVGRIMDINQATVSRYIARALKELTEAACIK